jgi:hypothetical protein
VQQAQEPRLHAPGQARGRFQPVNALGHPPAAQAVDTPYRQLEQNALIEQVTVTHLTDTPLVNQWTGLQAASAPGHMIAPRLELYAQGIFSGGATGNNFVAWPESSKINRMHGDSRDR